ncbi:MAG: hypothetical protein ACE5MK_05330 [Acidobacteriota bacterium]
MVSYSIYKIIHLIGIFMIFVSLGGLIVVSATDEANSSRWRKLAAITNGIGLVVVMVAGFGLLARLPIDWPWPGWVFLKMLIWLIFAAMIVLTGRVSKSGNYLWWGSLLLAGVAAYLALFKPF